MTRFITSTKKQEKSNDITFIIAASSIIQRAKNAGPKSLYPVDKSSNVLDIQYSAIKNSFPEAEILLITGHMSHLVINFKISTHKNDIKIIENQMFESCGQLEEVRLALNTVTNNKIFLIGDVLFNSPAIKQINTNQSSIIYDTKNTFNEDEVGCIFQGMILQNTTHGIPNKWSKIVYLRDNELESFRRIVNNRQKSKLMINEGINYVVNCGGVIKGVSQTEGYIIKPEYLK